MDEKKLPDLEEFLLRFQARATRKRSTWKSSTTWMFGSSEVAHERKILGTD
jgi:hypothetical protein